MTEIVRSSSDNYEHARISFQQSSEYLWLQPLLYLPAAGLKRTEDKAVKSFFHYLLLRAERRGKRWPSSPGRPVHEKLAEAERFLQVKQINEALKAPPTYSSIVRYMQLGSLTLFTSRGPTGGGHLHSATCCPGGQQTSDKQGQSIYFRKAHCKTHTLVF